MLDKIMAVFALALMVAFIGVFLIKVPEIDLMIILAIVLVMLVVDFVQAIRSAGQQAEQTDPHKPSDLGGAG